MVKYLSNLHEIQNSNLNITSMKKKIVNSKVKLIKL